MARQIIVLDATLSGDATAKTLSLQFVCWLTASPTRINPLPNFVSRVPSSSTVSWGITPTEATALQTGAVVEQSASCQFDLTLSTPTFAQMEASLQAKYTALQAALAAAAFSVQHVVGASWDGTTWSPGP